MLRHGLFALLMFAACSPSATSVTSSTPHGPIDRPPGDERAFDESGGLPLAPRPDATPAPILRPRAHRAPICIRTGPSPAAPPPRDVCCYVGQAAMRAPVMARARELSACYEAAEMRDRSLAGTIVGRFGVDHDGLVRSACEVRDEERSDGIDDPVLVACVLRELTRVVFPPYDDACPTMSVVYPLRFAPSR